MAKKIECVTVTVTGEFLIEGEDLAARAGEMCGKSLDEMTDAEVNGLIHEYVRVVLPLDNPQAHINDIERTDTSPTNDAQQIAEDETTTKRRVMDATAYEELLSELQPAVDRVIRAKYGDVAWAEYRHLSDAGALSITACVLNPVTREKVANEFFVTRLKVIEAIENVVWVWCMSHPQYAHSSRGNSDHIFVVKLDEDGE